MKKNFTRILLTCLLCTVMLCVAASAEAVTVLPSETDGKYDVTYTGTAGEYYAILVVEGTYEETETPTITEDSILYISQETAGTDGNATFADFLPKTATEGTIYIGGSDLDKAVLFGYLSTGIEETATISGNVTSDSTWEATVTMTDTADDSVVFTVETTNGVYTIESVPFGTYKFVVTKNAHLSYTKNEMVVEDDTTVNDIVLLGGDATGDGVINELDLGGMLTVYNSSSTAFDITGDGYVTELDLGKLLTNYLKNATVE